MNIYKKIFIGLLGVGVMGYLLVTIATSDHSKTNMCIYKYSVSDMDGYFLGYSNDGTGNRCINTSQYNKVCVGYNLKNTYYGLDYCKEKK